MQRYIEREKREEEIERERERHSMENQENETGQTEEKESVRDIERDQDRECVGQAKSTVKVGSWSTVNPPPPRGPLTVGLSAKNHKK